MFDLFVDDAKLLVVELVRNDGVLAVELPLLEFELLFLVLDVTTEDVD